MPTGPWCADGFPNPMMQFRDRSTSYFSGRSVADSYSVLIPGMKFTCNAKITRVIVGGVRRSGNERMKLRIWKENATRPRIYHKSEEIIDLIPDICDYDNSNGRYVCRLMGRNQISVEPGDMLGIELPPSEDADFELYSVPAPLLLNYIFEGTNLSSMVNLCKRIGEINMRPLIMVRITGIHYYNNTINLFNL